MPRKIRFHSFWLLAAVALGILLAFLPFRLGAEAGEELDRFVASLEGGWMGGDNITPFGKMDFVLLFERVPGGGLHARTSLNSETYIDLRFTKDERGRWILREEASMEGLGVQAHDLVPAGRVDGMHRWVHGERPEYLSIDVGIEGDRLEMDVWLRGQEHVRFRLDRLPAEALPELANALRQAALLSPDEGTSIVDVVKHPPADLGAPGRSGVDAGPDRLPTSPIEQARQSLAASPESAEAHLALARLLGDAIREDSANGPRFAFEMLSSLQKAIELDPSLAEAYHWLVGYYMNAPPIAGGSLDRAEETARRLMPFDPQGSRALLAEIDARRAGSE